MKKLTRLLCLLLSFLLFVQNTVLAHTAESNFWKERGVIASRHPRMFATANPSYGGLLAGIHNNRESLDSRLRHSGMTDSYFGLPLSFGRVRQISPAPKSSDKILIHIQDVHLNAEAQENIGKTIETLIDQKK